MAAAWAVVGLGMPAAVWLALSPPAPAEGFDPASANRTVKSRNRDLLLGQHADFGQAVRVIAARPASPERDQALMHALSQWADHDPEEAEEWLLAFPGGELRDWLVCATVTAVASHDPLRAASLLESELIDGLARNHAIVAVAQRWAQRSPDVARQWVDRLDSRTAGKDAHREIGVIERALAGLPRGD